MGGQRVNRPLGSFAGGGCKGIYRRIREALRTVPVCGRDVRHVALLVNSFRFIAGKRRTWHCGAHTLVNSQETCFVTGLAAARQIGADYPFDDSAAKRSFNYYGSIVYGPRFRKVKH